MRIPLALFGFVGVALAQGVTQLIVPSSTPPAGCQNSRNGAFTISVVNVTTTTPSPSTSFNLRSRNLQGRDFSYLLPRQNSGTLTLTLVGGVLTDQANRTGYIASNYQFQFDGPPQAGAIYTAGFGICANATLSLGGSAIFWQCLSGDFYNLYDRDWAEHCVAVYLEVREGVGSAYSTAPPGPESTGPSENTIANGGGTQTTNSTATFGATSSSGAASASGSETGSGSASGTSSGGPSETASQAASSASSSAGAGMPTGVPEQVFAWVAGIVGAAVLV